MSDHIAPDFCRSDLRFGKLALPLRLTTHVNMVSPNEVRGRALARRLPSPPDSVDGRRDIGSLDETARRGYRS
jgi:hypothetical protein